MGQCTWCTPRRSASAAGCPRSASRNWCWRGPRSPAASAAAGIGGDCQPGRVGIGSIARSLVSAMAGGRYVKKAETDVADNLDGKIQRCRVRLAPWQGICRPAASPCQSCYAARRHRRPAPPSSPAATAGCARSALESPVRGRRRRTAAPARSRQMSECHSHVQVHSGCQLKGLLAQLTAAQLEDHRTAGGSLQQAQPRTEQVLSLNEQHTCVLCSCWNCVACACCRYCCCSHRLPALEVREPLPLHICVAKNGKCMRR